MDLFYSDRGNSHHLAAPPVIMVGSNHFALARAASLIEGAGLRVADTVTVSAAQERLGRQAAASAIWIELDGQFDAAAEQLLDEVNRDVAAGHYAAVVSTTSALIDPVVARLNERSIELIVDADDRQRAAAIAIAHALGLGRGDALLFTVLCASASYIAVPAAMRLSVPEANPGLYVTMALALTFPFNIIIGLPLYMTVINRIWS